MEKLKVKLLTNTAHIPYYAHKGDSGLDLYADIPETRVVKIEPGERVCISTGIAVAIQDENYEGQVRSRSGLTLNKGLIVLNAPGTIDSNYRGEVGVILANTDKNTVTVEHGDKIAQLVLCPIVKVKIQIVQELEETDRGSGGFGSTGDK